jgi:hypothetical protein
MTTVTVEIDKEKDLPLLQELLGRLGLKYHIDEDNEWGNLPPEAIEGIEAGLADVAAGRVNTTEEVFAYLEER